MHRAAIERLLKLIDPNIFFPFIQVQVNEVVVQENDVSKALLEYVANNYITHMVIGASTRNALSK